MKSSVGSKIKNKTDKINLSSNEIMGKMNVACKKALQYAGLEKIIDKDKFISALLERVTSRRKKRRASRRLRKQKFQLSELSSSDDSSSSTNSEAESDHGSRRRRPKEGGAMRDQSYSRSRSRSRSQSKRRGKLCSGINEKPKESDLVMKVKWATAMLGTKHEVSFDQMTFSQYIMGETQILNRSKISEAERDTRIYLMKRISKLNEKLSFHKSKELYRESLNAIEKGEFFWCDFYQIERLENEIRFNNMKVDDSSYERKKSDAVSNELKWCKDFNSNKCAFTTHHNGKFAGQIVKLHHICRICWSKLKEKKFHRAGAEECQFTKNE